MPELLQRLQDRLKSLPDGLQAHIYRVRDVAQNWPPAIKSTPSALSLAPWHMMSAALCLAMTS